MLGLVDINEMYEVAALAIQGIILALCNVVYWSIERRASWKTNILIIANLWVQKNQ